MKKRLLIMMTLLVAMVTGAWAKTIYVYPKAWDMTGNKIALYSWNPSMFDDLQADNTYPGCYKIEVDNSMSTGVFVLLLETAVNSFDNKLDQALDADLEQPEGTTGDILVVVTDEKWNNKNVCEVTTIDHLAEYVDVQPKEYTDEEWEIIWQEYAYNDELGYIYSPDATTFKVWEPMASSVSLKKYATGSDIEVGAQDLGTTAMEKLMDGDKWTGVWTTTVEGNIKGEYYTYIVDGEEIADPWSVTTGFEGKRSMVCDMNDTNPESWSSDIHVFYEHGNAITYVDVPTFSADPMSGVSESNMGKYLALTENGTTYGNEGMVPTCMFALKEDGTKAVVIDIDAPQTMPDNAYVSNPYDGNSTVNDFKQVAQAVHNTFDMSLFVRFDFSATPVHKPMTKDFVVKTCLYWVDEYHADGIVLATDLDAETKAAVREALDAIDTRIILATDDEITDMQTGIEGVKADGITKGKGIYTIDGRRLNGKPAQKGIYINGGKKIAVQ